MKVSLAQFGATADKAQNLRRIEAFARQAAAEGASMLFLPEYSMFYTATDRAAQMQRAAEATDGPFVSALSRIARQNGLWLACGIYEAADGLPYNTVVLLDHTGVQRGSYRKQKLYDAFGCRESDECRAGGETFSPIETPIGRLGVITCFELRFPSLAAAQRTLGAEVLLVPAGWVCGAHKLLHWHTLLCARAIENRMTVLGVDQYAADLFIGHSAAFAPDGTTLGALAAEEGLLTITI